MLDQLYCKESIQYIGNQRFKCPDGTIYQGKGISRYLYGPKKIKPTEAMSEGIKVHKQIETKNNSSLASNNILQWYDQNLKEYKSEVFVASTIFGVPLIGYIDTIGYTKDDKLVIIDNKITRIPESQHKGKTKWYQQLVSYAIHLYNMTGILPDKTIILACNPDTGDLNTVELSVKDYSQVLMTLKKVLNK